MKREKKKRKNVKKKEERGKIKGKWKLMSKIRTEKAKRKVPYVRRVHYCLSRVREKCNFSFFIAC